MWKKKGRRAVLVIGDEAKAASRGEGERALRRLCRGHTIRANAQRSLAELQRRIHGRKELLTRQNWAAEKTSGEIKERECLDLKSPDWGNDHRSEARCQYGGEGMCAAQGLGKPMTPPSTVTAHADRTAIFLSPALTIHYSVYFNVAVRPLRGWNAGKSYMLPCSRC